MNDRPTKAGLTFMVLTVVTMVVLYLLVVVKWMNFEAVMP